MTPLRMPQGCVNQRACNSVLELFATFPIRKEDASLDLSRTPESCSRSFVSKVNQTHILQVPPHLISPFVLEYIIK